MNILMIVPYVPDLVRVRPYQLLRGLAARGNQVTLLTIASTPEESQAAQSLTSERVRVRCFILSKTRSYLNCVSILPSAQPLQAAYCWHPELARQAQTEWKSGKYDAIHVEHLRGVRYALDLIRHGGPQAVPLLWDSVDSISHLFRQAVAYDANPLVRILRSVELARTMRYEALMCSALNYITVTSPVDLRAFEELDRRTPLRARLRVLPNGTDLAYFNLNPALERQPASLVVSGKMSYHANIRMTLYLAEKILPRVWRERPETRLSIVGKDPPESIRTLACDERIEVTGTVADIRPYLHRASLAVAPVQYGAGIQNKVLEAMACGTPVVCSSQAVSALQAQNGRDLFVADDPDDFARHILSLLNSLDLRERTGRLGREYVVKNHNWDTIAAQLEGYYRELK
jgi:polysaccharide biosynthesis protein PslH